MPGRAAKAGVTSTRAWTQALFCFKPHTLVERRIPRQASRKSPPWKRALLLSLESHGPRPRGESISSARPHKQEWYGRAEGFSTRATDSHAITLHDASALSVSASVESKQVKFLGRATWSYCVYAAIQRERGIVVHECSRCGAQELPSRTYANPRNEVDPRGWLRSWL